MAIFGISLLGFFFMLFTGLYRLERVPGIHFDEAWAANYAYRIFAEKAFWPTDAMSPYTHPWSHYITAGFFRVFGPSLFVYRAAGVSMCVLGAVLAWTALIRIGERKAAMIFPYLLAFFVPFVCNERFCLEITSFHILCLGLLALGAQMRSPILLFVAIFFGATSHILFLAPVLGLLGVWGLQSGKWQLKHRFLVFFAGLSLWPFLWKVYKEIPEKDKAVLLLAADTLVLGFVLFLDQMPRWIRRMRENIKWFVATLSLPFFLYLVVFSEAHWSVLFTNGRIFEPWILFFSVPLTLAGWVFFARRFREETWGPSDQRFWSWFLFTVFWVGVLAVKPAPRYFAMVFFLMAMGGAILLGQLPTRKILTFMVPFSALGLLILSVQYLGPGLDHQGLDRSYRFLFFRDSSEDSLPKQDLARFLGEKGCRFAQVSSSDARLMEALRFLSHADWPVSITAHCPGGHSQVERLAGDQQKGGDSFERFRVTWGL